MQNQIKFKKSQLSSYKIVREPMSKVKLAVATTISEKNKVPTELGHKYIVGLKAIAEDKLGEVLDLFEDRDEVNIEEMNGLTLTGSIWVNEGQPEPETLPLKGEEVLCNIQYVTDRQGDEVLRVTTMAQAPAQVAETFDFDKLFASVNSEEHTLEQAAN